MEVVVLAPTLMNFLFRKFTYLFLMLFLISAISFGAIHAAPNSFFAAGGLNPNMGSDAVEHLKEVYGLDRPLVEQYLSWMFHLSTLDFGVSFVNGQEVSRVIFEHIGITLVMNSIVLVLVFILSLYLGIRASLLQGSIYDKAIIQLSLFSFSMPSFYLSLIVIVFFGVYLDWFPVSGLHSNDAGDGISYYLDMAYHLILPIGVMLFISIGSMIMYVRSLSIDILKSDYIFFALARGLSQEQLMRKYILPNLISPLITLLGLSLPGLIGGSVILESIFSIDGMGQLFYQSALSRDYPVIMGILMITAFLTLVGNTLSDMYLMRKNPFFARSK